MKEPFDFKELLSRMKEVRLLDADPDERVGSLIELVVRVDALNMAWLTLLRVRCATTGRYHVLRVPHGCRTAREANAWTWGLEEDEYRPVAQA